MRPMHTELAPSLQSDAEAQRAQALIQACVHCGFCTATCPSYQVLGNELDSPRGRIYLIKEMLENDRPADARVLDWIGRLVAWVSLAVLGVFRISFARSATAAMTTNAKILIRHVITGHFRPPFLRWGAAARLYWPFRPILFARHPDHESAFWGTAGYNRRTKSPQKHAIARHALSAPPTRPSRASSSSWRRCLRSTPSPSPWAG